MLRWCPHARIVGGYKSHINQHLRRLDRDAKLAEPMASSGHRHGRKPRLVARMRRSGADLKPKCLPFTQTCVVRRRCSMNLGWRNQRKRCSFGAGDAGPAAGGIGLVDHERRRGKATDTALSVLCVLRCAHAADHRREGSGANLDSARSMLAGPDAGSRRSTTSAIPHDGEN